MPLTRRCIARRGCGLECKSTEAYTISAGPTRLSHHREARASGTRADARPPIEDDGDSALVVATGIQLACDLGDALHQAYQGEPEFRKNDAEKLLRVHWRR